MLIDEVHLLNEARGSVLEAGVVSRVRVVSKLASMKQVRVFAFLSFACVVLCLMYSLVADLTSSFCCCFRNDSKCA